MMSVTRCPGNAYCQPRHMLLPSFILGRLECPSATYVHCPAVVCTRKDFMRPFSNCFGTRQCLVRPADLRTAAAAAGDTVLCAATMTAHSSTRRCLTTRGDSSEQQQHEKVPVIGNPGDTELSLSSSTAAASASNHSTSSSSSRSSMTPIRSNTPAEEHADSAVIASVVKLGLGQCKQQGAALSADSAGQPITAIADLASDATSSNSCCSSRQPGRPSKQSTSAEKALLVAGSAKRGRGRPRKQRAALGSGNDISQQLTATTGLPAAAADKLAALQLKGKGMPQEAQELQSRVMKVLALLGHPRGARAITKFPRLIITRPEVLAHHLQCWVDFFADVPGDPEVIHTRLLDRLAARPQLLMVNVENLVGNLYEIGAIVQAEDLQAFSGKALKLALMRPEVAQEKMRRVLLLLTSESRQNSSPLKIAHRLTASLAPAAFDYSDIQKAARRDSQWLMMSIETLEARLLGLQQVLQISLVGVGRVFVLQPSLVHKTTQHIADRLAALKGLPGMDDTRARDAVLAFPALLNLRPELLRHRWQQLQQAAASFPAWRQQLDSTPAGSLPSLLTLRNSRYVRLQQVAASGQQASRRITTLLHMSDSAFEAFAAKHLQQQQQQQQSENDA